MLLEHKGVQQIDRSLIPFCIRIGVTGPRTLPDDKERLAAAVREAIETRIPLLFDGASKKRIRKSPHTPIAFSLLTSLADGADRLVADIVMNLPDASIRSTYRRITGSEMPEDMELPQPRLEPILPLMETDYRRTFTAADSEKEFERLLAMARLPVVLRVRTLAEDFPEGSPEDIEASKKRAFFRAGQYVVNNCDVLIALTDDKVLRGEGFTAATVGYARNKNLPLISISIPAATCISTESPFEISVEKGGGLSAEAVGGIEMFNAQKLSPDKLKSYLEDSEANPFDNSDGGIKLPPETRALIRERLLPYYAKASELAAFNRKIYQWVGLLVYCFAAMAVAAVALGTLFHQLSAYAFSFEFALLLSVFLMVFLSDRHRTNKKWTENRFLAERLSSAMFFAACGIEVPQAHVQPSSSIARRGGAWMMMVFNEVWERLPVMSGCDGKSCGALRDFVSECWLGSHIRYHARKSKKSAGRSRQLERAGIIVFVVAMAAPVVHLIFFNAGLDRGAGPDWGAMDGGAAWLEKLLTFAALSLPAAGAAIGGIRSHRELSRLSKRSQNMEANLRELEDALSIIERPETLEMLLHKVDELMLFENQDWLMMMKPARVHYVT